MSFARVAATGVLLTSAFGSSCTSDLEIGRIHGVEAPLEAGLDTGVPLCSVSACQGKIYACGDCLDNDGDGLVDSADDECLGPCDNTEDSYFGGIPGQNQALCRMDCYFDNDTGGGNDGCAWHQACDPLSVPPRFPPSGAPQCAFDATTVVDGRTCTELETQQSATCLDVCGPLTPNGCDCFGCCELAPGSGRFAFVGSSTGPVGTCDKTTANDPEQCRPCTPVSGCFNPCGPCELCVGRTVIDETACATDGGAEQCPSGVDPCGTPAQPPCSPEYFCLTGCCVKTPT